MNNNDHLTQLERARMRSAVRTYMHMRPGPAQAAPFAWFYAPRPIAAATILLLFAASGGVSFAAEGALPGDLLYPIKVNVNEPVQGALAISQSAKIAWGMDVAGERLKEAATLAAEGRLSSSTQQQLQTNFEQHASQAIASIGVQASTTPGDSAELATSFDAQLSEYQRILAQIGTTKDAALSNAIASEQASIAAVRALADASAGVSLNGFVASSSSQRIDQAAAAHAREAAKRELKASMSLAQDSSRALASSSAQTLQVQLRNASATISAGDALLGGNSLPQAIDAYRSALDAAEKIGIFLQTSADINSHTGRIITQPDQSAASSTPAQGDATVQATGTPAAGTSTDHSSSEDHGRGNSHSHRGGQDLPIQLPIDQ